MPWTGDRQTVLGAHEVAPAQMVGDRVAQPGADPGSRLPAGPVFVMCRRRGYRVAQLLLQRGRHGRWGAVRCRVPASVHALRALGVVALGNLPDPVGRIARHGRDLHRRVALAQEPEDLPPAALIGFFGRPIAALEVVHAQMGLEMNLSGHAPIVQPPNSKPYESVPQCQTPGLVGGGLPRQQPEWGGNGCPQAPRVAIAGFAPSWEKSSG